MRERMKTHLLATLLIVLIGLIGAFCAWGGTVDTSTQIWGQTPSKGYTIYAKSFTTAASAEVVGYSSVASAGYNAPGKRVRVVAYELSGGGTTNVKFQSGGADDINGGTLWYLVANKSVISPVTLIKDQPIIYLQSGVGASLSVNLSAGQAVSGTVYYFVE